MSSNLLSWIGGGVFVVFMYVVVSNTLWLLLGSRFLQELPGVNVRGLRGTVKIAVMLVLSGVGTVVWTIQTMVCLLLRRPRPSFLDVISRTIQHGARIVRRFSV
jgi:hypothetical protein